MNGLTQVRIVKTKKTPAAWDRLRRKSGDKIPVLAYDSPAGTLVMIHHDDLVSLLSHRQRAS